MVGLGRASVRDRGWGRGRERGTRRLKWAVPISLYEKMIYKKESDYSYPAVAGLRRGYLNRHFVNEID